MNTSTKNLMFLLGAAPMSMAGCLGDGISDTLSTLTGASATFTTTMTTNETGDAGDGDGDGGDGDGTPGDGDGAPGDGDGAPGDGDGDGDGEPGDGDGAPGDGDGDPGSACEQYAAFYGMCYGAEYEADALGYCEEGLIYAQMYGNNCLVAYEALVVCLSQLTCEEFQMDPPPGCEAQGQAFLNACQ